MLPALVILFILLLSFSEYRPVYKDPFLGQAMLVLLAACFLNALVKECVLVRNGKRLGKQRKESAEELQRLVSNEEFLALYVSGGDQGKSARNRVSELVELAGGWPNKSIALVFEHAMATHEAETKIEPLNRELRKLVSAESFESSYCSLDSSIRSECEKGVLAITKQLGESIDPDIKDVLKKASERRRAIDRAAQEEAVRIKSLNDSLIEMANGQDYEQALWSYDITAMDKVLSEARPIIEELNEKSDSNALSKVRRLEDLRRQIAMRENAARSERMESIQREKKAREELVSLAKQKDEAQSRAEAEEAKLRDAIRLAKTSAAETDELKKKIESAKAQNQALLNRLKERESEFKRESSKSKALEEELLKKKRAEERGAPTEAEIDQEMAKLDSMDGWSFESYCADLFRSSGYRRVQVTSGSEDQGIDVIAEKNGIRYGIQCKNYSTPVGNKAVQEAFAGKSFHGCHVAVVLTNSAFSPSAVELGEKH